MTINEKWVREGVLKEALTRDSLPGKTPDCGQALADFYREHVRGIGNETEKLLYLLGYVVDQAVEARSKEAQPA